MKRDPLPPSRPGPAARPSLLLLACLLALTALHPAFGARPSKPNVLVLLADDAGWGDYSHSGNRQVKTPNIDRIAQRGASLERFYVCPVCSPTRAEFLTGRYHLRCGVRGVSEGQERLNLDEKTVADAFQKAGYATGAFGKWHNGSQWPYHPIARGFDEYFGHSSGHWGEYFNPPLEDQGRMVQTQGYIVDGCTDRALDFIERNKERPFFCYVPFTTPHTPWIAPEADWQRLRNRPIEQRASNPEREDLEETRCALAMLENQDWNVGRLLAKLQQHGLEDNTIVLYFSDNGPNSARWNGGMRGLKGSVDEGGVRSVCFLSWPARIEPEQRIEPIAAAIDLLPTLTSLAGVPPVGSHPLDGRDLSPLLLKQPSPWPDRQLFSTWGANWSVRTQSHRLLSNGQLFDILADPGQLQPCNSREPELAAQLTQALQKFRTEMRASPLPPAGTPPAQDAPQKSGIDPRPIPVGYREFPITLLPARDGEPQGGVQRSSRAPNCSYFVNWTRLEDRMVWHIKLHTSGRYEASIDYTCPLADAGSTVQLDFRGARISGKVVPGWDPPLLTEQDTLPNSRRHGESAMKEFRTLKLGEFELSAGEGPLTLRALDIPGQSVMDVRRVTLTLLPP
jgi:arylsulfatase A-like enzyme